MTSPDAADLHVRSVPCRSSHRTRRGPRASRRPSVHSMTDRMTRFPSSFPDASPADARDEDGEAVMLATREEAAVGEKDGANQWVMSVF